MRDPRDVVRSVFRRTPDDVEPLAVWDDRASHRCRVGSDIFVVKAATDVERLAHEIVGHRRAAAAGLPVPEIVAEEPDAFVMRWQDGTALHDAITNRDAWHATGRLLRDIHLQAASGAFGEAFAHPSPTWHEFVAAYLDDALEYCVRAHGLSDAIAARIRAAHADAAPCLETSERVWCHGDCQPAHVLVDGASANITAVLDWADHGPGDRGWDIAVLTLYDTSPLHALLDGYAATQEERAALDYTLPLYRVIRLLGSVRWLAERGHPWADVHLALVRASV